MILFDHKKAMATMMSKRDSKDGSLSSAPMKPEIAKDEEGKLDGRHAAAEDILMAIHEKSADKLNQALQNHHDLHMDMRDEGTEEPEVE